MLRRQRQTFPDGSKLEWDEEIEMEEESELKILDQALEEFHKFLLFKFQVENR